MTENYIQNAIGSCRSCGAELVSCPNCRLSVSKEGAYKVNVTDHGKLLFCSETCADEWHKKKRPQNEAYNI